MKKVSVVSPKKSLGLSLQPSTLLQQNASRRVMRSQSSLKTNPTLSFRTKFSYSSPNILQRSFATDDSGFHADFKTIRKKYEGGKSPQDVQEFIKKEVESHPVVVFMKGTAEQPMCGFSGLVARILQEEGLQGFRAVNVLEDPQIREGIKKFTNWPTIPQVFINKEFIGGSDIIKQLFESGELANLLKGAGVELKPPAQ